MSVDWLSSFQLLCGSVSYRVNLEVCDMLREQLHLGQHIEYNAMYHYLGFLNTHIVETVFSYFSLYLLHVIMCEWCNSKHRLNIQRQCLSVAVSLSLSFLSLPLCACVSVYQSFLGFQMFDTERVWFFPPTSVKSHSKHDDEMRKHAHNYGELSCTRSTFSHFSFKEMKREWDEHEQQRSERWKNNRRTKIKEFLWHAVVRCIWKESLRNGQVQ